MKGFLDHTVGSFFYIIFNRFFFNSILQPGSPPGVCKNVPAPVVAAPNTPSFSGSFSGSVQLSGFAPPASYPNMLLTCSFHLLMLLFLWL